MTYRGGVKCNAFWSFGLPQQFKRIYRQANYECENINLLENVNSFWSTRTYCMQQYLVRAP